LPVEVNEAEITNTGLRYDRSFVLVKDSGEDVAVTEHLTIKTTAKVCLFQPSVDFGASSEQRKLLKVKHTITAEDIEFHLTPTPEELRTAKSFEVEIFGTQAVGVDMGEHVAEWFSRHLEQPVRLLYIGGDGTREGPAPALVPKRVKPRKKTGVLGAWFQPGRAEEEMHPQKIQFADAAPLLLTTASSEREVISRLIDLPGRDVETADEDIILRFRSNIHLANSISEGDPVDLGDRDTSISAPYAEESWKALTIHPSLAPLSNSPVHVDLVFNTVRCQSLNVDFSTGEYLPSDRQLYKLLATKDRRVNAAFPYRPCFGRYGFAEPFGAVIRVGDVVHIEEKIL
jgi:uncharacterized protein